ncbi:MAG: hypothetical protein BRD48_02200 [Bacteroidetes bacterium QS_9_68_14]|nr:MAG: hypothetical protein BRD48_02200 [Bacteroidetes bacterium QS_9_68_14]
MEDSAVVQGHPQPALAVGVDVVDRAVGQARLLVEHLHEPAPAVDDEDSLAQRGQHHLTPRQAGAVVELRIFQKRVNLGGKGLERRSVVEEEVLLGGADEDFPRAMRDHHVDRIVGEALAAGHDVQRVAFHAQQPTLRLAHVELTVYYE